MTKTVAIFFLAGALSLSAHAGQQGQNEQPLNQEQQNSGNTPNAAQAHIDKGRELWVGKKLDLAEAEFRKAIEENPESAAAHASLAGLLLIQNKTKESIPAYQDAIMLDPQNAKLFAALSIAYLHQSNFSMAKAMADEALRLDPEMKQAATLNEYIETKLEVIEQAEKVPAEAVGGKPDDALHNPQGKGSVSSDSAASPQVEGSSTATSPH